MSTAPQSGGCCWNTWSKFANCVFDTDDLDKVFCYPTLRFVIIQDRHLGLLRYGLMIAVFVYIFVYQLVYSGAYLAIASPEGQAHFRAIQPTINCSVKERADVSTICTTGCDPDLPNCYDFFSNASSLPYCAQSTAPYKTAAPKRECHFQESQAVVEYESSAVLVTRADEFHQTKVCSASQGPLYPPGGICDRVYNTTSVGHYYYGQVEDFNVSVVHSMYHLAVGDVAPAGIKSNSDMDGALYVPHDDALCADPSVNAVSDFPYKQKRTNKAPCYIMRARGEPDDIFTLKHLMAAADLDLDSGDPPLRYTGTTLIVSITYNNWRNWHVPGDTSYIYRVTEAKGNRPRADSQVYDSYPDSRVLLHRYGIQLVAIQSGNVHSWDFTVLLLTLTTSLTLLAVSTTITDMLALYVLERRKMYKKCKYVKTKDFSDIKKEDEDRVALLEDEGGHEQIEASLRRNLEEQKQKLDAALAKGAIGAFPPEPASADTSREKVAAVEGTSVQN